MIGAATRPQVSLGPPVFAVGFAAGDRTHRRYPQRRRNRQAPHLGQCIAIIGHMAEAGADILDCDWMVPLDKARAAVGPRSCWRHF